MKQNRLEGTDSDLIKEIIDAADSYEDIRNERMDLTKQEVAAQEKLLSAMKKHDLVEYSYEGKRVYVVPSKEKVKVRSAESPTDDDQD